MSAVIDKHRPADLEEALAAFAERRRLAEAHGQARPADATERSILEGDYVRWLRTMFPTAMAGAFGDHHAQFWRWLWAIEPGTRPAPFVGIWPRGGGKSTGAQGAIVALAALRKRKYGLYVSMTQEQADKHLADVETLIGSPMIDHYYPLVARRKVNRYGYSRGWRHNRLWTAAGFIVDAIGLDTATRGVKAMNQRPDFMVFDDIDSQHDTLATTQKKIITLTQAVIPAGSGDCAILAIQNLMNPNGVFARLADTGVDGADFLADREVSGPVPAVYDLEYEQQRLEGGRLRFTITGGRAAWAGQNLAICQGQILSWGLTAFLIEAQHLVGEPPGGLYSHLDFEAIEIDWADLPVLVRGAVWVDPAVTEKDDSDACGIQADGIGVDGRLYRLYSWEDRAGPETAMTRALTKLVELRERLTCPWAVGVETDQGGDTWKPTYLRAWEALCRARGWATSTPAPTFRSAKAGEGYGGKVHRSQQMLADYERDMIRHVRGTHTTLRRALYRFPKTKPLDLTDAAYWSWADLREKLKPPSVGPAGPTGPSKWRG